MLACSWHHCTLLYIRSYKSLQLERDRQICLGLWLMWHPYSAIQFYWDCFTMVMTFAVLTYMPVHVFFQCKLFTISINKFYYIFIKIKRILFFTKMFKIYHLLKLDRFVSTVPVSNYSQILIIKVNTFKFESEQWRKYHNM